MSRIAHANGHNGHNGHVEAHFTSEALAPTAESLAATCGITLTEPLSASAGKTLKKAYAGHAAVLAQVLQLLGRSDLHAPKLDVKALEAAITERQRVATVEAALAPVARSAMNRRLVLDDLLMTSLTRIARFVRVAEDPAVRAEWAFLTDFLGTFARIGARRAAEVAAEKKKVTPTEPPA